MDLYNCPYEESLHWTRSHTQNGIYLVSLYTKHVMTGAGQEEEKCRLKIFGRNIMNLQYV